MEPSPFVPSLVWVAPFASLLVAIALLPVAAPRFWQANLHKLGVSALLGLPIVLLYLVYDASALGRTTAEYLSFIIMLGSFYVVSGGVAIDGDLRASPAVNTAFLAVGALSASFVGTVGTSMLLIHPLLHTNRERRHVTHTVVFFIFLVSNIGGCLTPLGDPPLLLGYLRGVPFTWTFRLAPAWLTTVLALLLIYFVWDRLVYARESPAERRRDHAGVKSLRVAGKENLALVGSIVAAAAFLAAPLRELVMIGLAGVSLVRTPPARHRANHFSFHPILEVAAVFAGIFATMIPALTLLRIWGGELGVREPWQFFWATGGLSSFLDNAPTYLAFLAVGQGQGLAPEVAGVPHRILAAISLGAVFMGANTYIGNAPNFMVRSIAESRGVRMPTFGGYMLYSGPILLPLFLAITLIFFSS